MAESLIIRDGNANYKNMQVDSGSYGYVPNHSLVSTAENSNSLRYYVGSGWDFNSAGNNTFSVANADKNRKGIVIHNNSAVGVAYILLGNGSFGTNPDMSKSPQNYSFMLDSGATYFGDTLTCAVKHSIYVVSSSFITNEDAMSIAVSQIY